MSSAGPDFSSQRGKHWNGKDDERKENERPANLHCYPIEAPTTPPALGDFPIPQFPFEWEPLRKDGKIDEKKAFSPENPFNRVNFAYRGRVNQKVVETLEEWQSRLSDAGDLKKAEKIRRLGWRVKDCGTYSVGMNGNKVATNATGAAYFRTVQRCNSRFCSRCAKKAGRAAMERIFKRCNIDPDNHGMDLRFLTLTMPGEKGAPLAQRYKRIRAALKRLYRSDLWHSKVAGAIGKIEVTKNADNWHVHAHFLLNGDFIKGEDLRAAWAKALKENPEHINCPWIERAKPGKGAFYELAKYIAKPVSFIGKSKGKKIDRKTGEKMEGSKEWTTEEMIEFFEVFSGARIFMTTGNFKDKKDPQRDEFLNCRDGGEPMEIRLNEIVPPTREERLEAIITRCPINFEAAKQGHTESMAEIVFDAGMEGFTKKETITKLTFLVFNPDPEQYEPPDKIKRWSNTPARINEARELSAIEWERRKMYREELKRARDELRAICEVNGMYW